MTFRHLHNRLGFFSEYYLGSVFGRDDGRGRRKRLSDKTTDVAYFRFRRLHAHAESRSTDAPACREKFIRPLLRDILGLHLGAGEGRVHLLWTTADAEQSGGPPLLAAWCGAWDEDLDAAQGAGGPAKAVETAMARHGLGLAFILSGLRARLVRATGDGVRGACLEVDLDGLVEEEDPESFAAFLRLFHASDFVPSPDGRAPIDEVEGRSREHAQKVSEDLKRAVFAAAETLPASAPGCSRPNSNPEKAHLLRSKLAFQGRELTRPDDFCHIDFSWEHLSPSKTHSPVEEATQHRRDRHFLDGSMSSRQQSTESLGRNAARMPNRGLDSARMPLWSWKDGSATNRKRFVIKQIRLVTSETRLLANCSRYFVDTIAFAGRSYEILLLENTRASRCHERTLHTGASSHIVL